MASTLSFNVFHNVINGQLKGADNQYHGINPWNEKQLWPTPVATENDVEEAVLAANAAFKTWSKTTLEQRRKALQALAEGVLQHQEGFKALSVAETGKSVRGLLPKYHPLAERVAYFAQEQLATFEVLGTHSFIHTIAGLDIPEHVTHDDDDVKIVTKYVPIGVVAAIVPWNYPLTIGALKLVSSVLTGNTLIIKPSLLKLAELASQYLPPGVVQALGGDDDLGPWLVKHPDIAKISFTGSSATGKKIMANAAPTLKRVTLELGGNDAAIVCANVDIAKVAQILSQAAFSHSGQVCIASKRIYVHSSIYNEFMQTLTEACRQLTPGSGIISPIQNSMQYNKVKSIFEDCVTQGYSFALGDGTVPTDKSGYFVPPTIVAKPPEKSKIVVEEPFGPIVPVLTWDEEAEVLERANDTTQGLGATVFSNDLEQAQRLADGLEAGSVWINRGVIPMPTALFGGHKQSGIGADAGPLGLLHYCNQKTYHIAKKV